MKVVFAMDAEIERLPDGRYNGRSLGQQGYFPGSVPGGVGKEIDYYDRNGDKKSGTIRRVQGNTFWVDRDNKPPLLQLTAHSIR